MPALPLPRSENKCVTTDVFVNQTDPVYYSAFEDPSSNSTIVYFAGCSGDSECKTATCTAQGQITLGSCFSVPSLNNSYAAFYRLDNSTSLRIGAFSDKACAQTIPQSKLVIGSGSCTYSPPPVDTYLIVSYIDNNRFLYGFNCEIGTCEMCEAFGIGTIGQCIQAGPFSLKVFLP